MLNSEAENVNIRVVATLVIVAHLEESLGSAEVLLQGLQCSTVEAKLQLAILEAQIVGKSAARGDSANLVQVLALTTSCNKLNTDRDLAIAVVVNLSLVFISNIPR